METVPASDVVQTLCAQNKTPSTARRPVRISACCSTGERFYAGEGLLGLARVFLGGRHSGCDCRFMGATDASTQQLMDSFYDSLNQGTTPDVALRKALSPARFQ